MKIKTSELIDIALDWAVAKCAGIETDEFLDAQCGPDWDCAYSVYWAKGGPIIHREGIALHRGQDGVWWARIPPESLNPQILASAPTPLIAAMRCYVASNLGDEVDVPVELLEFA